MGCVGSLALGEKNWTIWFNQLSELIPGLGFFSFYHFIIFYEVVCRVILSLLIYSLFVSYLYWFYQVMFIPVAPLPSPRIVLKSAKWLHTNFLNLPWLIPEHDDLAAFPRGAYALASLAKTVAKNAVFFFSQLLLQ